LINFVFNFAKFLYVPDAIFHTKREKVSVESKKYKDLFGIIGEKL